MTPRRPDDERDHGRDEDDAGTIGRESEDDPVEVPPERLSADALRGLVEEFVTRDGTDYGAREAELASKVRDVLRQVEHGEVRIVFDPASGTANLMHVADLRRRARAGAPSPTAAPRESSAAPPRSVARRSRT